MRSHSARLAVVAAAFVTATSAFAQSNPVARQQQPETFSQEGFFRPTPDGDPSLTGTVRRRRQPPRSRCARSRRASAMYAARRRP